VDSHQGIAHHNMPFSYSFIMFSLMLLVMSIAWLFLIMSWLQLEGLLYAHIVVNALQTPLLLYICVLRQRHVTFLLKNMEYLRS